MMNKQTQIGIKTKKIKKNLTLGLLGVTSIFTTMFTSPKIEVSAHNTYFVSITIDEGNFRYIPTVQYEQNSLVASNHEEANLGCFSVNTSGNSWSVPTESSEGKSNEDMESVYEGVVDKGDGEKALIYSFPSVHGKGIITEKVHANGQDEYLANRYANYVVGGLNDALNYCVTQSGAKGNVSIAEFKVFSANLANKAVNRSGTVTLNGTTFTISADSPDRLMDGLDESDYVKISDGNSSITVPMRVKKGYIGDNPDRSGLSDDYLKSIESKGDTEYLDWKYTVLQGNYNADVKGITYSNLEEIVKPNTLEVMLGQFLGNTLRQLRQLLGLYEMEDLMLNSGVRSAGYFYGIMPQGWMKSASLLYVVSQVVAWSCMGFSFVKLLFKRQLQTMNIGERVSLMEGFKNLIFTAFLLGSFMLIFNAFAKINYVLVDLFSNSSAYSGYIGKTETMTTGGNFVASILINFAFFILSIYFNFFYILRGITIALLFGIAPLCIFSLSLGGKYAGIFSSFMKELVSNIFIQTFHAICIAFFTSVTSTTQMRTFELLVVFMAFIPLTNFVRQNIFGLSGGITDQAQGMASMGRAAMSGVISGTVGATLLNKGNKQSGSGSGGNSMTSNIAGTNPVNSTIQNAMANRQIHSSANGLKGGVNNSDLMRNISGVTNTENASQALNVEPRPKEQELLNRALNLTKGGLGLTASIGAAGLSLGSAGMGDRMGVHDAIRVGNNITTGSVNAISQAIGRKTPSDIDNTGITGMYDGGEHMTNIYDAKEDENGKISFADQGLNNSYYGQNIVEMYNAFNGQGEYAQGGSKEHLRGSAIARYKNQGIIGVGTYRGQLAINYDKKMTEKKNFSMRNIGEISPYVEQKAPNQNQQSTANN